MTEPVGKGIEIQWDIDPRKTRVWIEGHEISRYVLRATIEVAADDESTVTLVCVPIASPTNLYSVGEPDAD